VVAGVAQAKIKGLRTEQGYERSVEPFARDDRWAAMF
jgi:hypothetical protein